MSCSTAPQFQTTSSDLCVPAGIQGPEGIDDICLGKYKVSFVHVHWLVLRCKFSSEIAECQAEPNNKGFCAWKVHLSYVLHVLSDSYINVLFESDEHFSKTLSLINDWIIFSIPTAPCHVLSFLRRSPWLSANLMATGGASAQRTQVINHIKSEQLMENECGFGGLIL